MLIFGKQPVRALKANNFAVRALEQSCDPQPLIDLFKQRDWWGDFKKMKFLISSNSIEALLAAGEADAVLTGLRHPSVDRPGPPNELCVFLLWESRACVLLERWEEAVQAQNQAMASFKSIPANAKGREGLQWDLCCNGYTLRLHHGMTDGLEPLCLQLLDSAPTPRYQVEAHLLLGRLYLALDRPKEAEEHLAYAVQHGNKLWAKTQAQLLLSSLRGEAPDGTAVALDALRRVNGLAHQWKEECRFSPSLDICRKALDCPGVAGAGDLAASLRQIAATALSNLGRPEEAAAELGLSRPSAQLSRKASFRLSTLMLRSAIASELDQTEEAIRLQNEAVALFQKDPSLESSRFPLTRNGYFLQLARGQLEGLEPKLTALLDTARDTFERVSAHMLMARYLLALHRDQEARPHLEYVVQHGGELHFRPQAQAFLDALPSQKAP